MDTRGLITLRYSVMNTLNELEDYSMRNYKRFIQLAIDGYRGLHIKHLNSVKVAYLPVDMEMKTVQFPSDYVEYVKIAVSLNGQVWTLTRNDKLHLPREFDCGLDVPSILRGETQNIDTTVWGGYYFTDHLYMGRWVTDMFGIGGGFNSAYYRIDEERRQIVLNGTIPNNEIILEYVSTGIDLNEDTLVPVQALDALKAYIHWKNIEYKTTVPMGEKQRKEQLYYVEAMKLDSFEDMLTLDEYFDQLYESTKQTPKR
jgi:hypothetical protein